MSDFQLKECECFKIVEELKKASEIQLDTMPKPYCDTKISMEGIYMPYEFLGGDLYNWIKIDENRYGIIILDIMGHGISTSMVCMYIRSVIPLIMEYITEPVKAIKRLNEVILNLNEQLSGKSYHATALYMIIDTKEKSIHYVNAAHPYGLLMDEKQNVYRLEKGGIPLGIFEDAEFEDEKVYYNNGDKVFLYTDGIYEILRQNGLEVDYLLNYVKFYGTQSLSASATLDKLSSFLELLPRDDDVSLVYIDLFGGK